MKTGAAGADDQPGGDAGNQEFQQQAHLAGQARMVRLLHLVIIVEPPDQPEPRGHQQARPDVGIEEVHPQQDRDRQRDQDQEAAHRRRAAFGKMALRPVLADRLALALRGAKPADELGSEQQPDKKRSGARGAGAEADVADEVEDAREAELLGDHVEHAIPFTTRSTSFASPTELDALTSTASPGRTI